MTKERDIVRPYVVDGIEEYDNPMPSWWLGFFWFTIVWSAFYLMQYHVMGGASINDDYAADIARYKAQHSAALEGDAGAGKDAKDLAAVVADPGEVAAGKDIYQTNCAPCHGQAGEGVIGPNLTDDHWLHGGSNEDIAKTISEGVPLKGMISWGPILGPKKINQVTAYIVSLLNSKPPNAKAAEGDVYERN